MCEATWRGEVSVGGGGEVRLTLPVGAECGGVAVLEHVHVTLDLASGTRRGEFAVRLLSPTGTLSQLLAPRPLDNAVSGTFSLKTKKCEHYVKEIKFLVAITWNGSHTIASYFLEDDQF